MTRIPQDAQPDVDPVIEAYEKDVDRSLVREALRLTVEERFERSQELQSFAAELRAAGRRARSKA